jgi:hypothetical protein
MSNVYSPAPGAAPPPYSQQATSSAVTDVEQTNEQIAILWLLAGGPVTQTYHAVQVAQAESSGNAKANNVGHYGLYQIASPLHLSDAQALGYKGTAADLPTWLYDPWNNTRVAVRLYGQSGWTPWDTDKAVKSNFNTGTSAESSAVTSATVAIAAMTTAEKAQYENEGGLTVDSPSALDNALAAGDSAVASAASPFGDLLGPLSKLLNIIESPGLWARVGLFVGAAILLILGIVMMIGSDKTVKTATKTAAETAAIV